MKEAIKNVAIIMDGNGRWAKDRGYQRVWGHVRGSQIVSSIIRKADDLELDSLTLYAFSQENFLRPTLEVRTLFKLLKKYLIKERQSLIDNNVFFRIIGSIKELPVETQKLIHDIEEDTRFNTGLRLNFAFGYSGQEEMIDCVNSLITSKIAVTKESINNWLQENSEQEIDLLIRTGGDQRVSNFLLWQISYAEMYFSPLYWPDFGPEKFEEILNEVSSRDRRFGQIHENTKQV